MSGTVILRCKTCGKTNRVFRSQVFGVTPRYINHGVDYQCRECWNRIRSLRPVHRPKESVTLTCTKCGKVRLTNKSSAAQVVMENYQCRPCYLMDLRAGLFIPPSRKMAISCQACGQVRYYKPSAVGRSNLSYCIKCKNKGERHSQWRGGTKRHPYADEWGGRLREEIRSRDGHVCQICGSVDKGRKLCVHHIDYVRKNCRPNNLISLCCGCHSKTNTNREEWIVFFHAKLKEGMICH